jgi:UPF0755 protein
MTRLVRLALALVAALALVGAGSLRWLLAPRDPAGSEQVFVVSPGEGLGPIAQRLEAAGLVRRAWAFEAVARHREFEAKLQRGEYRLSPAWPMVKILEQLAGGHVVTHEVVVPEGFTAAQIADRLAAAGLVERGAFLGVVRDPASARALGVEGESLEGYLFPETYRFARGLAPQEVARAFVEQFRRVWQSLEARARERGLSMHEVVTLASIIEKETGVPLERPLIASVFLNRMHQGMRLETDPTVIYGIADFDGNLRRRDLEDASNPYNTYRIAGLPPGPIANPGAAALRAVVEPARTSFLYFVSRNDGSHTFSTTYAEHLAAVNRYQRGGS